LCAASLTVPVLGRSFVFHRRLSASKACCRSSLDPQRYAMNFFPDEADHVLSLRDTKAR
jgi:hypothetical protein